MIAFMFPLLILINIISTSAFLKLNRLYTKRNFQLYESNPHRESFSNSNRFHLAIEAGELSETIKFYTDILGCMTDMEEKGKWIDIDFWGNELTLHQSKPRQRDCLDRHRHHVDMGDVMVPHLGIHLKWDDYIRVKSNVKAAVGFLDDPYIRFEGTEYQQETFFCEDPNFNVLEIKSMMKDKA